MIGLDVPMLRTFVITVLIRVVVLMLCHHAGILPDILDIPGQISDVMMQFRLRAEHFFAGFPSLRTIGAVFRSAGLVSFMRRSQLLTVLANFCLIFFHVLKVPVDVKRTRLSLGLSLEPVAAHLLRRQVAQSAVQLELALEHVRLSGLSFRVIVTHPFAGVFIGVPFTSQVSPVLFDIGPVILQVRHVFFDVVFIGLDVFLKGRGILLITGQNLLIMVHLTHSGSHIGDVLVEGLLRAEHPVFSRLRLRTIGAEFGDRIIVRLMRVSQIRPVLFHAGFIGLQVLQVRVDVVLDLRFIGQELLLLRHITGDILSVIGDVLPVLSDIRPVLTHILLDGRLGWIIVGSCELRNQHHGQHQ